jgi:hypothetical protein
MERYSPFELVGGSHFCGPQTGHVQTHTPFPPFPKSLTLDDMMIWSWPLDFQFGWLDREYGFKDHVGTTLHFYNPQFNLKLLVPWGVSPTTYMSSLVAWTTTKWSINQSPNHQVPKPTHPNPQPFPPPTLGFAKGMKPKGGFSFEPKRSCFLAIIVAPFFFNCQN